MPNSYLKGGVLSFCYGNGNQLEVSPGDQTLAEIFLQFLRSLLSALLISRHIGGSAPWLNSTLYDHIS